MKKTEQLILVVSNSNLPEEDKKEIIRRITDSKGNMAIAIRLVLEFLSVSGDLIDLFRDPPS